MNITLGISPCPNDTFMFAALANGWVRSPDLDFTVVLEDVETLNEWAGLGKLDVSKLSFHRGLTLENTYHLMSAGAALGHGCGPLLIAHQHLTLEEIIKGPVALPGRWTTAHLLLNIFYPGVKDKRFLLFSGIEEAVLNGSAVAGVIIHENRFTYAQKGLIRIADLGEAWEERNHLPIPLGGIFASNRLENHIVSKIDKLIYDSIVFARANPEKVMLYVRKYAQEMDEDVMQSHIRLYVNDFSLNPGVKGLESIAFLKKVLS